jgi:hypothetical protein
MDANLKGFLEGMAIAPVEHMDPKMLPKFKALAENNDRKAADLLRLIDECVRASLCSDFSVQVMDIAWQAMLENEGKTVEQGFAEATWRREQRQSPRDGVLEAS